MSHPSLPTDLSIVIPAFNEQENLAFLLPNIHQILGMSEINYEITVVDENANAETRVIVQRNHCNLLSPNTRGYGAALKAGIEAANGEMILTMDADLSHPPDFIQAMWAARNQADIVIASRYVPGGKAIMPVSRLILSKVLNNVYRWGLNIKINDTSSGFRLYKASKVKNKPYKCIDFDFLQEVLVKAIIGGCVIAEVPFTYQPRRHGSSHARVFKFGLKYIRTFIDLWKLRYLKTSSANQSP